MIILQMGETLSISISCHHRIFSKLSGFVSFFSALKKQAYPMTTFGNILVVAVKTLFILSLQDLPPGEKIYSLSGAPARYASAGSNIELITLIMAAEFHESLQKMIYLASGSCCRSYIGLGKYERRRLGGLNNTKTASEPMKRTLTMLRQNGGAV